jgi:hypothetical protein
LVCYAIIPAKEKIEMVTKELVISEIEKLDEKYLDEIYEIIKKLTEKVEPKKKKSFLEKLQEIQIEGPSDLSVNHELYASGEKTFE